jgi:pyrroline-5-carboxylate reductase
MQQLYLVHRGTAYALRYLRASIQGGIEIGFNAEIAQLIAAQTA